MTTSSFFNASDIAELCFALALILWAIGILIVRHFSTQARITRARRRARCEPCRHPAWRVDRLAVRGEGQALKITCFRCGAPALDRFALSALADGSISLVNHMRDVQLLVIEGTLHEIMPASQASPYEDDLHESEYAVFLQPPDLRK